MQETQEWNEVVEEGLAALSEGRHKKAEGCLTRALTVSLRHRHRLSQTFLHLTTLYLAQGRFFLVDELLKQAMHEGKDMEPRLVADTHRLYGLYFEMQGENVKARQAFADALSLCEGPEADPQVLMSVLRDFSWFSLRQGQERARTMFKRGLELAEKEGGPNHPTVISFLNGVARCEIEQNRCARAEQLLHRAVALAALAELDQGHPHPDQALCLESLGLLYEQQQSLSPGVAKERKIPLPVSLRFQQAAEHLSRWVGATHPRRVSVLLSLCRWELQLGHRDEAREALQQARAAAVALPESHPFFEEFRELEQELSGVKRDFGLSGEESPPPVGSNASPPDC